MVLRLVLGMVFHHSVLVHTSVLLTHLRQLGLVAAGVTLHAHLLQALLHMSHRVHCIVNRKILFVGANQNRVL